MKKLKFINTLILLGVTLIMAVSMLGGCKKKNDGESDGNGGSSENIGKEEFCVLAENGKTDYSIVYDETSATGYTAAKDLKKYLEEATGAVFPLVENGAANAKKEGKYISLGKTSVWNSLGITADKTDLNRDGYYVKTVGGSIVACGATDRSSLYGAYYILENMVGVRFFADDCYYVPKTNKLVVYKTDVKDVPDFDMRLYFSGAITNQYEDFSSKMRFESEYISYSDVYGGTNGWYHTASHTSLSYVPPAKYYAGDDKDKNAHMYSVSKGQVWDLCYTDGITDDGKIDKTMDMSAVKIAADSLEGYILESPENVDTYMFGQQDNQNVCNCDRCKAAAEKYKRSGMLIRFVNALSDEVSARLKEKGINKKFNIVTFAYQYTEKPPVKRDESGNVTLLDPTCKPRENIYVRLATIDASRYYSFEDEKQTVEYRTLFEEWSAIHDKFMVWTYHTNYHHGFWYMPSINSWYENLKYYKKMGVTFVFMQATQYEYNQWQNLMETYVASKALWNTEADIAEARKEYIHHYFGEIAEPFINTFIRRFDEFYEDMLQTYKTPFVDRFNEFYNFELYDIDFLESQLKLLTDAEEEIRKSNLSDDEKTAYIRRVRRVSLTPRYMILYNYNNYYSKGQYDFAKAFFDICDELGVQKYSESGSITSLKQKYGI